MGWLAVELARSRNATFAEQTPTVPYEVMPKWTVLPDAAVAVVSPSPFRIEFVGPDSSPVAVDLLRDRVPLGDAFRRTGPRRDSRNLMAAPDAAIHAALDAGAGATASSSATASSGSPVA